MKKKVKKRKNICDFIINKWLIVCSVCILVQFGLTVLNRSLSLTLDNNLDRINVLVKENEQFSNDTLALASYDRVVTLANQNGMNLNQNNVVNINR
ncbi:MAG: hypothetical protein WBO70_06220 [Erysipelotrichaceae bacterium]